MGLNAESDVIIQSCRLLVEIHVPLMTFSMSGKIKT